MFPQELPITGYLDRFSHRPGERFSAHVSLRDDGSYRARLVRVICADPNPAGPGIRLDDLSHIFTTDIPGRRQAIDIGSYAVAPSPKRDPASACTWTILVNTAASDRPGTLFSDENGPTAVTVSLMPCGIVARIASPTGEIALATGTPLPPRIWVRVTLSADPATGRVLLTQTPIGAPPARGEASGTFTLPSGGTFLLAARDAAAPRAKFTGKLEAPAIFPGMHHDGDGQPAHAAWDFSDGIGTQIATDVGPQSCHARLINLPARGMVGSTWTGAEMCWRHAPRDYAAIQFHDDDLADCHWAADFEWTVPDDLPSGAYALHLTCDAGEDWLPLYILPARDARKNRVAFLASTFTYQAYANHARGNADAAYKARTADWGGYHSNPDDFPIYGRSTYNKHADGSGHSISSRARPVLTMRPAFMTFNEPVSGGRPRANTPPGSGLRHYPADTHILAWLTAKNIAFDVITDEDLDDEGLDLLRPYAAVMTGSHPEYHTPGTLDALRSYTHSGGKLLYLGGNGFYWRVARVPELPHIIELRRAEGGIRAWAAEPGEYYHQLDGGYGGLWRRNRRPPQMLAGVGFSGQGLFEGTHYRRLPASHDPTFAWMFQGIDGDIIGDYGLSGGGAAGFELDRADFALGTPANTQILARSEDPPHSFVTVPEELLSHIATITGERPNELKRGEIIYFDTPSGGAVFAVGSITFCGSLWHPDHRDFTGPVSQLLENVLRRFLEIS